MSAREKHKPDLRRLKDILKSDEFLGREKFEELRRQFGRQGKAAARDLISEQVSLIPERVSPV